MYRMVLKFAGLFNSYYNLLLIQIKWIFILNPWWQKQIIQMKFYICYQKLIYSLCVALIELF